MISIKDGREKLYQWDTNRYVTVPTECSSAHFSNKILGRSIDVAVIDGEARIPDVLLQVDKCLHVWAFVGSAADGYTKISKVFDVEKRNKPADYFFTQEEYTNLSEVLERVEELESKVSDESIANAVEDYLTENPVEVPVLSVNDMFGDVQLSAEDVGALPADTIIPTVPKNVSEFENDAKYQNAEQVQEIAQDEAKKVEEKIPDVPTNVSSFVNDAKYQTANEVAETVKTSADAIEKKIPTIPKNVSEFMNDARYQSAEQVQATVSEKAAEIVAQIPTVPTEISAFRNDAKYQTEEQVNAKALEVEGKIPTVPSNVSAFNNDAQYQTLDNVNAIRGEVVEALNGKQNKLTFDDSPVDGSSNPVKSGGVYTAVTAVLEVANGKCKSYVFDTVEDLDTWLQDSTNTAKLKTGDVFLIRDVGVPDYWWDADTNKKQILETTKVDLSDYALKSQLPTAVSQLNNDAKYQNEDQVNAAVENVRKQIPTVPTKVSTFENDAKYATEGQVAQAASAVEAKIPTVPTKVSSFTNDAGYQTAAQVESVATAKASAVEAKIPTVPTKVSQFTNDAGYQTEEQVNAAATAAASAVDKMFVFEIAVSLSQAGMSFSLPADVTVQQIANAYDSGFHVVAMVNVPSAAGSSMAGLYLMPLVKKFTAGGLLFCSQLGQSVLYANISASGAITYSLVQMVQSISASSSHAEYPTAKAVYDYIESRLNGLTLKAADSAPTTNDPNVITFVNEG